METKTVIILTPEKEWVRMRLPAEHAKSEQTVLNYLHTIIDAENKNAMHSLTHVTTLAQETLDKYGVNFEKLPDELFLNLSHSRLLTYNAAQTK